MPEHAALYEMDGGWFRPSEATRSPWHPGAQHGGPPTALAVRAVEAAAGEGAALARLTVEFLHEVPFTPLAVRVSVERPGRRVALHRCEVSTDEGPVAVARAWMIRSTRLDLPTPPDPLPPPPPAPETLPDLDFTLREYDDFFGTALDKRLIAGRVDRPGRAAAWFRLTMPVVAGEKPSPLQQLAAIADSGNGISWTLPFDRYLFINTDLTLAPFRAPVGEWFAIDSVSHLDATGRGTAFSALFDEDGWLGRSTQTLYVDER